MLNKDKVTEALAGLKDIEHAVNIIMASDRLRDCNPDSIRAAFIKAEYCGISPNSASEFGNVVARNGQAKFELTYKGMIFLATKDKYAALYGHIVYEKDQFDIVLGDRESAIHKPALKNRGPILCAYAVATTKDGTGTRVELMLLEDLMTVKEQATKYTKSGPWFTNESEMFRKTPIRRLFKTLNIAAGLIDTIEDDPEFEPIDNTPTFQPPVLKEPAPEKVQVQEQVQVQAQVQAQVQVQEQEPAKAQVQEQNTQFAEVCASLLSIVGVDKWKAILKNLNISSIAPDINAQEKIGIVRKSIISMEATERKKFIKENTRLLKEMGLV